MGNFIVLLGLPCFLQEYGGLGMLIFFRFCLLCFLLSKEAAFHFKVAINRKLVVQFSEKMTSNSCIVWKQMVEKQVTKEKEKRNVRVVVPINYLLSKGFLRIFFIIFYVLSIYFCFLGFISLFFLFSSFLPFTFSFQHLSTLTSVSDSTFKHSVLNVITGTDEVPPKYAFH